MDRKHQLQQLHARLRRCQACPNMQRPAIHGPPVVSPVVMIGQAPGSREGAIGQPFAWTAGKTLFRWFESATGVDEATFRRCIYISAVARCFPGKASSRGDRRPDREEILRCSQFLARELAILRPALLIPVGAVAIEQVLGHRGPLVEIIGMPRPVVCHGVAAEAIALPHPSGASTWHHREPGRSLLAVALRQIAAHPAFVAAVENSPSTGCDGGALRSSSQSP